MSAKLFGYQIYHAVWAGLDLVFPPMCGGCKKNGSRWCSNCQQATHKLPEPVCDVCGLPQRRPGICRACLDEKPAYEILRSWTAFEGPVRQALHRLKYRSDIGLGEALAIQMSEFVVEMGWRVDLVVPIPLSKKRAKERGYNQVAMVAWPLSMQMGWTYNSGALERIHETRSQVGLSAEERKENVRDVFKANGVKGRTILLVDDVATTGATLASGAEALKDSGANAVYSLTIARVLPHHGLKLV